jgi:hypothetical protein
MRTHLLAMLLASAALPASAASIENIRTGNVSHGSIISLSCADCSAKPVQDNRKYAVPALPEGVASMAIVDHDGKPQVMRVDKFMGGSPVRTVSQTQGPLIEQMRDVDRQIAAAQLAARNAELSALDAKLSTILPPDARQASSSAGIDRNSTTAAVDTEASAQSFDPSKLTLRLN